MKGVKNIKKAKTMSILKIFYLFKKNPEMSTLRVTPLFNLDFDLSSFKYIVEKIFKSVCDVLEKIGDGEMTRATRYLDMLISISSF